MPLSRRDLLKHSSTAGALLIAPGVTRRGGLLDLPLNGPGAEVAASRRSPLLPGLRLVHADMHNHSLMSDGDGDPANAFASMRGNGLDVAALTDHATVGKGLPGSFCAGDSDCQSLAGIDEASWAKTAELADAAYDEGTFVAIRGFEWSSPTLGHMNVWFSDTWTDPLHTGGLASAEHLGSAVHANIRGGGYVVPKELTSLIDEVTARSGTNAGMALFYEWLNASPDRPGIGGGADGIAGFNHPGREFNRFGGFTFDPAMRDRVVSLEVFNRKEDYLFEGVDNGEISPIVQCLDNGWRPGLLGVTDEHGTDWGNDAGKGRGGLWVRDLTRDAVREAMQARRFFATNTAGLRLAVVARSETSGAVAPMGSPLDHAVGPLTIRTDLDLGPDADGRELSVQVLTTGAPLPELLHEERLVLGAGEPFHDLVIDVDAADVPYLIVRVTDPALPADGRATGPLAGLGKAIAYASPISLDPSAS